MNSTVFHRLWMSVALLMFGSPLCLGQRAELIVQSGHSRPGRVYCVAFSPNGRTLASGSGGGDIKLWEVASGRVLRTLEGQAAWVSSVAFSPDGQTLVSAGRSKSIRLWDVATGEELRAFKGHVQGVNSVTFSPDGQKIASGSDDYTIKLWEVASGKELLTLQDQLGVARANALLTPQEQSYGLNSVAFSSDGKTLAGLRRDGTIKLWDIQTGEEVRLFEGYGAGSVVFSPNGETLASGSNDQTIKLWNVTSGKVLRTFQGSASAVNSVVLSTDGRTLASGHEDGSIKLWDIGSGKELRTLQSPRKFFAVNSVAFSPDGQLMASGESPNANIDIWDVSSGEKLRTLQGTYSVLSVVFSPDLQTLARTTVESITLWRITTPTDVRTLKRANVPSVAFSPDGQTLASGRWDKSIKLFEVATGMELRTFKGHAHGVTSVAFSPNGKTLASGCMDNSIKLWEVASGIELRTLQVGQKSGVYSVAFSPDDRMLAAGSSSGTIKVWEPASGRELRTLEGRVGLFGTLAFSPDGKMLASGGVDTGVIKVWEVASGKELHTFVDGSKPWGSFAFSSDGRTLASGAANGSIKLIDVLSGRELRTFRGHATDVNSVAFSPDGKILASSGKDGESKLWDMATQTELCSLIAVAENDWLVVTPDGLFDGSPAAWNRILWRFSPRLFDIAPVEAFFSDFYHPGLLAEIFAGKRPLAAKDITQKDRRLPSVNLALHDSESSPIASRTVSVRVTVSPSPADKDHSSSGGALDLRLFRNGSLVKVWRGDLFTKSRLEGCNRTGDGKVICEAKIRIVAGENRFTAYAFNRDNIKSEDAGLSVSGAESLKRLSTAYIFAIGINEYSNSQYNLRYAGADAQAFADELQRQQIRLKQFDSVKVIFPVDKESTKANILKTLKNITSQAQPADAIFIYFAGHGTAQGNRYYLVPHDLGYTGARMKLNQAGLDVILSHSISDRELEQALEKMDARTITLVLDTCNSGQALESDEKRRGPMNSKGLAQLAYEKGMYILTAAESFQAAREAARLGHGYLTYALVEEGLKSAAADSAPNDGQVTLREWLDYATQRVPRMQQEALKETRDLTHPLTFVEGDENIKDPTKRSLQTPRVYYRREPEGQPLIVAKP